MLGKLLVDKGKYLGRGKVGFGKISGVWSEGLCPLHVYKLTLDSTLLRYYPDKEVIKTRTWRTKKQRRYKPLRQASSSK